MVTPRIRLERVVAVLLPAPLLWVFAACVLICGWESAASYDRPDFAATAEVAQVAGVSGCEDCPDASFLKATTTERVTFKSDSQAASDITTSVLSATPSADGVTVILPRRRPSLAAPPLKLSSALRI